MKISVVVATRNRDNTLQYLLQSLLIQTYPKSKTEIIIVNYGGDTRTEALVKRIGNKNFKYIYVDQKGIFNESHSKNVGIRSATGDVVVCTNADIIFSKDCLKQFSKVFKKTGGHYLYQLKRHDMPDKFSIQKNIKLLTDGSYDDSNFGLQDDTACGDFQAAKRQYWNKVRGYDELMTGWGRMDLDLAERMELINIKQLWMDSDAIKIYHQFHPTKAPSRNRINYELSKFRKSPKANLHEWGEKKINNKLTIATTSEVSPKLIKDMREITKNMNTSLLIVQEGRNKVKNILNIDEKSTVGFYQKSKSIALAKGSTIYMEIDHINADLVQDIVRSLDKIKDSDLVMLQPYTFEGLFPNTLENTISYNLRCFDMRMVRILLHNQFYSASSFLYCSEILHYVNKLETKVYISKKKASTIPVTSSIPLMIEYLRYRLFFNIFTVSIVKVSKYMKAKYFGLKKHLGHVLTN